MENDCYDVWSVRSQGEERALIMCHSSDSGRPDGDFIKWLGSFPRHKLNLETDVIQRELKRVYADYHPLKRGSVARTVRDKLGALPPPCDKNYNYWVLRSEKAVISELKRRRHGFISNRHIEYEFFKAMLDLLKI